MEGGKGSEEAGERGKRRKRRSLFREFVLRRKWQRSTV